MSSLGSLPWLPAAGVALTLFAYKGTLSSGTQHRTGFRCGAPPWRCGRSRRGGAHEPNGHWQCAHSHVRSGTVRLFRWCWWEVPVHARVCVEAVPARCPGGSQLGGHAESRQDDP